MTRRNLETDTGDINDSSMAADPDDLGLVAGDLNPDEDPEESGLGGPSRAGDAMVFEAGVSASARGTVGQWPEGTEPRGDRSGVSTPGGGTVGPGGGDDTGDIGTGGGDIGSGTTGIAGDVGTSPGGRGSGNTGAGGAADGMNREVHRDQPRSH